MRPSLEAPAMCDPIYLSMGITGDIMDFLFNDDWDEE